MTKFYYEKNNINLGVFGKQVTYRWYRWEDCLNENANIILWIIS